MARKKKAKDTTQTTEQPRKRKRAEKMPEGTFAAKLRIGPVTEAHMAGLAAFKGLSKRKTTRNTLKEHLTAVCVQELERLTHLQPQPVSAMEDDLLS